MMKYVKRFVIGLCLVLVGFIAGGSLIGQAMKYEIEHGEVSELKGHTYITIDGYTYGIENGRLVK